MVHMGFYNGKLCRVPPNCVMCVMCQFGGGGYQVTMKPIEPQGHLSKQNIISKEVHALVRILRLSFVRIILN